MNQGRTPAITLREVREHGIKVVKVRSLEAIRHLDFDARASQDSREAAAMHIMQNPWKGWYGQARSAREVEHTLDAGHPDGVAIIEKIMAETGAARIRGPKMRKRPVKGSFGDELDPHAVKAGQLDRAWRRTEKTRQRTGRTKRVEIYVSFGLNSCDTEIESYGGLTVAAVVAAKLVAQGVSVGITGIWRTDRIFRGKTPDMAMVVPLKGSGEKLSLSRLAVAGWVGWFRTQVFVACHKLPGGPSPKDSLGSSRNLTEATARIAIPDFDAPGRLSIVIGKVHAADQIKPAVEKILNFAGGGQ